MTSTQALKLEPLNREQECNVSLSSPFYSSKQLNLMYFIELLVGIIITISAIYFNRLQCDWFCWQTNHEFAAICVYIFLYPLGFMLIIDSMSKITASKSITMIIKAIILTLMGFGCILVPIYLFLPTHWNGSQYFKLYKNPPISSHLNIQILSFQMFILWPPFGLLFILMTYRLFKNDRRKRQNIHKKPKPKQIQQKLLQQDTERDDVSNISINQTNMSSESSKSLNLPIVGSPSLIIPLKPFHRNTECLCLYVFIFIIIPLMWLSTTLLPSGYDKFTLPANSKNEGTWKITEPSPSAWTINWKIGNGYLHIYGDVFIYYIAILLTLLIGYIINQYKKCRKKVRRLIFVYVLRLCGNEFTFSLKIGQFMVLLIWIPIIMIIFIYFKCYHKFEDGVLHQPLTPFAAEEFVRTSGILSTIFCGLCLIPISRGTAILKYCFGLTFESGIKYHRPLGAAMIIFAAIHFIGFIILLIKNDYYSVIHIFSSQMPFNTETAYHGDNWTLSLMQIIVLFVFIPFVAMLWPNIRRKYWEIFYFIHIYGSLVIIIGLMYHAAQCWYFMLPGLILQSIDRLWRLWNCSRDNIKILSLKQISTDIARLRINIDNQHPNTALSAYYFINIPHIAPFEWHPFSVCNALNGIYTEFYIKNIGNYTAKLLNLTSMVNIRGQKVSLNNLDILIEGPFGCDIDYHGYHRLVLIAGGIGITPLFNLFFTLYNQSLSNTRHNNNEMYMNQLPSIDLIWIVRYADMFEIYKKYFNKYISSDIPNMKISLYATREEVRYPSTMHFIDNNNKDIITNIDSDDSDDHADDDEDNILNEDGKLPLHISNSSITSNKSLKFHSLHSSMNSLFDKKKKGKRSSSKRSSSKRSSSGYRGRGIRDVQCPIKWKIGRPDLFQELRYLDQLKNKAIVYVSGPSELVQTAQELAHLYGNHFKKETFLF